MKSRKEVEKNRISYHKAQNKNTVHRSSLLVPRLFKSVSNISFLNHFLIKRNNKSVAVKITAINSHGDLNVSYTIEINEAKVYSFNLEEMFDDVSDINEFLIEFFSDKNLYIPFPAVIVNHIGVDYTNCVHSFNRVLNDIFEDDLVNLFSTSESSIDVNLDEDYDTFFNFASGVFPVDNNLSISLTNEVKTIIKDFPIKITRLSNKNYFLSKIFTGKKVQNNHILNVKQPKQTLFYGRLLAGIVNKKTLAFSANHSFYDSSAIHEYFENELSLRVYPYFAKCLNKIVMYPIMSPSTLSIYVEVYEGKSIFTSNAQILKSPSNKLIEFNINDIVASSNFKNVSTFKVVAKSINSTNMPSRVNHQLIYGALNSKSKLNCSINHSLNNEELYTPSIKTGLIWGQVLIDTDYESQLGVCFNNSKGYEEDVEVEIDFYGELGLVKSFKYHLNPSASLIFDNEFFSNLSAKNLFLWFIAKSKRADIQAQSFHYHRSSHNASGEHSF